MSKSKRQTLDVNAIANAAGPTQNPVDELEQRRSVSKQRSRVGRVPIQGYFPEDTRKRLKLLAVQQDRAVEDLMNEALQDLFVKHDA